jgi:hypothetical protein
MSLAGMEVPPLGDPFKLPGFDLGNQALNPGQLGSKKLGLVFRLDGEEAGQIGFAAVSGPRMGLLDLMASASHRSLSRSNVLPSNPVWARAEVKERERAFTRR